MSYTVTLVPGLVYKGYRRGVAFVECPEDKKIDAKVAFDSLKEKKKQDVLNRFDLWQRGQTCNKYFHGWPNIPQYKECFVFKWAEGRTHHRLYGFLVNPKPLKDPGYRVCVLVSHARKNEEPTDPSELDGVNELKGKQEIAEAIKKAFPESGEKKG